MSDHDIEPLPSDLADLLGAEKLRAPEPDERTARIWSRVEGTLVAPAPGGGGSGGGGGGAAPVGGAGAIASSKMGLALALLAGVAIGAAAHAVATKPAGGLAPAPTGVATSSAPSALVSAPAAPSESAAIGVDHLPNAANAASPRGVSSAAPSFPAGRPSASAQGNSGSRDLDLGRERTMIDMARNANARGNGASALAVLRDHERTFPNGRLREERDVMLIQILAADGDHAEAERRAAAFRAQFPNSMLLPAVAAAISPAPEK